VSTFLRLLGVFGMLSVLAVGTGLAVLPEMKKLTVGQYDWVTANQFVDFYSLSQMAPGPNGGTEASIARFTALIGDVTKGDNMSFTWCPDKDVEVATRGTVQGTVPGDDFARTLFTVWFGPDPGDPNLKRGMLGT